MDIFDYNEDNLSMIARSCNYSNYRQAGNKGSYTRDVSCSNCSYWNGRGCSKKHLDHIASEMQLD